MLCALCARCALDIGGHLTIKLFFLNRSTATDENAGNRHNYSIVVLKSNPVSQLTLPALTE